MISPEKKTIEDILVSNSGTVFSVPKYQRSFDWGQDELQELIEDLKDLKGERNSSLFLGNFIFDVAENDNYKIVDGQQRLTTITLILIAIREHAKALKDFEFASNVQNLIVRNHAWNKERGNKILVANNIRELFEYISCTDWDGKFPEKINKRSVKRQVTKLRPIYSHIYSEIKAYNIKDLRDFMMALISAYVIVIHVEGTQDVFAIFERTNARGLDLNIGDLLKNYIFAHDLDKYEDIWSEIISNSLGSLQRMLKYFWVSRKGYIQQKNLYRSLKAYGNEIGISEFMTELYAFSRYYKVISSPDEDDIREWLDEIGLSDIAKNENHSQIIYRSLQALSYFGVTQPYPLIYSLFIFYKSKKDKNPNNLVLAIKAIENFHFINNVISGKIGNQVEKFYTESAQIFYKSQGDFIPTVVKFVHDLGEKKASKAEFIPNFIDSTIFEKKALISYVYDRINNNGLNGAQRIDIFCPEKDLEKRNLNIDHILPQNDKKLYDDEKELEIFDQIGNLLIMSRHSNSAFSNLPPEDKVALMIKDPKYIGNLRYLKEFTEEYKDSIKGWGFEKIENRSKDIAEKAYDEIWKL